MKNPLTLFSRDVLLILSSMAMIALAWTHLPPAWALAAAWFPTLLLVGRLRMMQTLYGHEGSPGHGNFLPRGHGLRDSKVRILGLSINDFVAALATSLALSQNEEDYGEDHGKHHALDTFGTPRDPDAQALYNAGFKPGMSEPALWRQLWVNLIPPKFHATMAIARARSNWNTATPLRRRMAIVMATMLISLSAVMPIEAWIASVLLPWTVLFHISGLLQVVSRHAWLEKEEGYETVEDYAEAMVGRFPLPPLPAKGLVGFAWGRAWTMLAMDFAFNFMIRIFTMSYDLIAHDFHHLEYHMPGAFVDDWTTMPQKRQSAIDEGRDVYAMEDRELYGWFDMTRHSIKRLSEAKPIR